MIFGITTFTLIHTLLSLVGIIAGWSWSEVSSPGSSWTAGPAFSS
jgi:hypothetical protein